jgi:hypothetical protein
MVGMIVAIEWLLSNWYKLPSFVFVCVYVFVSFRFVSLFARAYFIIGHSAVE